MSNQNTSQVELSDGRRVCLSYGVPVAIYSPIFGYRRRERRFSVTTSRHANAFAGSASPMLDEAAFEAAIAPLAMKG